MTIKEVSEQFEITPDTLRYYERIGAIPPVNRAANGIRNYQEEDLKWVKFAKCMRSAGLQVEAIVEYLKLFREGNSTIKARLELLNEQKEILLEKRNEIDKAVARIEEKIQVYEKSEETGTLDWK